MTNSRATPCVKGNGDGLINSFNVGCLSDAMGNAATRFEWDAENRLTGVVTGTQLVFAPMRFPSLIAHSCELSLSPYHLITLSPQSASTPPPARDHAQSAELRLKVDSRRPKAL